MIEAAIRGALAGHKAGGGVHGHLDERHFRRMEKYNGEAGKFREWTFQLMTAVGGVNPGVRTVMDLVQRNQKEPDWDEVFADMSEEDVKKYGAELYNLLVTLVSGEALTVVRGIPGDGWEAWHRLLVRFDPKTPARALRMMMTVMQPKKVKDIRELQSAVVEWEGRVKQLEVEHGITVDEKIQLALLTGMIPNEFQDYVFQVSDGIQNFKEIKDKIMAMALNRASLGRPMPMEVGQVRKDRTDDERYTEYWADDWGWNEEKDEVEIDYVGEKCLRCGGMGHYARECPTPKGKGKGKGKGGKGKGWKGKGKGGKGGFAGQCWQCGQTGHRASECKREKEPEGDKQIDAVEDVQYEVGGIWQIAHVTAEECLQGDWKTVKGKKGQGKSGGKPREATLGDYLNPKLRGKGNKFEVLEVTDEEYEQKDEYQDRDVRVQRCGCKPKGEYQDFDVRVQRCGGKLKGEYQDSDVRVQKSEGQGNYGYWDADVSVRKNGYEDVDVGVQKYGGQPKYVHVTSSNFIGTVTATTSRWRKTGSGEITVDSAAEESVCPQAWEEQYKTKKPAKWMKFVNASGGAMNHYGEKTATFRTGEAGNIMSLGFQVSDVKKPLAAVWRIAEKGNKVQFGPNEEDNFIVNVATGNKVMMKRRGGSYVIPADYVVEEPGFQRPV